MHRNDSFERKATKHPGSKSHRDRLSRKQRRRDKRLLRREAQSAKLATLNRAIGLPVDEVIYDEDAAERA